MNNSTKREKFREFLKSAQARYDSAGEVIKQAADEEALNGIKDPNSKGVTSIPGFGDGSNRSALGLPENRSNMGDPNKDRNIINVTNPDGTGQGEYISPRDGDAIDARFTSPTTPLDKIATALKESSEALSNAIGSRAQQQPQPEPQEKKAYHEFDNADMPSKLDDPDIMSKLAAMSLVMLGTEDGARAMEEALEKEAGVCEARAIINNVSEELAKQAAYMDHIQQTNMMPVNTAYNTQQAMQQAMAKQAAAQVQEDSIPYVEFQKAAMAKMAHAKWEAYFENSPMQKQAYQQGAADGEAAAAAMEEGGEPSIPGAGDVSADDVIAYLQQLVQAGQIQPQEAEAVLQALGSAGDDGVDPQEFADAIRQAVESGQISPEEAEVVAQQYLSQFGGADAQVPPGAEDAAAEAAMQDPTAAGAAEEGVQKAASVVNYLWN